MYLSLDGTDVNYTTTEKELWSLFLHWINLDNISWDLN